MASSSAAGDCVSTAWHAGASHTAPNPTPRKGVTSIMLRIRLRRYRDALGKNNSAAGVERPLLHASPPPRSPLGGATPRFRGGSGRLAAPNDGPQLNRHHAPSSHHL